MSGSLPRPCLLQVHVAGILGPEFLGEAEAKMTKRGHAGHLGPRGRAAALSQVAADPV